MILTESHIDRNYKILIDWIETIPVDRNGKGFLKRICFDNFYDSWILLNEKENFEGLEITEINNGLYTYGIKTQSQFNDFRNYFFEKIKKSRLKAIVKWSDNLKDRDDSLEIIDKHIYEINKKELLSEIGAEPLDGWKVWLKRFLENEKLAVIKHNKEYLSTQKIKAGRPKIIIDENLTLKELCVSEYAYNKIIDLFITKKIISNSPNFLIIININQFAEILKILNTLKYLKRKPTDEESKAIIQNTFNLDVSIHSVKTRGQLSNLFQIPEYTPKQ